MKIFWSEFASYSLHEIYQYYKDAAGIQVADKIKARIFASTKQLAKHPGSGQIELTLQQMKEGHRYLVNGNYKIIYKLIDNNILITDIFDSRQDPVKILRSEL